MRNEARVRWGILGAGGIAHRFATSLGHEEGSELVAISCRSVQKAAAFAEAFEVPRAYADDDAASGTGHERLLADPEVDAIYLALPHGLHRVWAERALHAGKAVLCEKPAFLTAGEMREVAAIAREEGVLFMEAMKTRFEPTYRSVRELVASGEIGALTRVEASLCNGIPSEMMARSSYYLDPVQGGCLLDSGIYCASWIDEWMPGEVQVTQAEVARQQGVDVYVRAELACDGLTGMLECAFDRAKPRQATLVGERGRIIVDDLHRPQRFTVEVTGEAPHIVEVPYEVDDFYPEIAHFAGLLRTGATESPIMSLDASVRCAELLDHIRAAW